MRWRGGSVALLTLALSVGAHAFAGGFPSGAGVALAVVVAGTVGASSANTRGTPGLIALLGAGQVLGHLVLAIGHAHTTGGEPPAMVAAHAAAVVVGALLIAAGGRLCGALSTAVRAFVMPRRRPHQVVVAAATTGDQPWQWMLLLRASVPHRGPPVCALR